jgi:glycosyltransferase involved in cell wall biosynthesis
MDRPGNRPLVGRVGNFAAVGYDVLKAASSSGTAAFPNIPPGTRALNDDRIKVLFVIGALTVGGTERQLIGILKHLDRTRFEPYLFTFYQHGELVSQVPRDVVHFCDETENRPDLAKRGVPGSLHRALVKRLRHYCTQQQIDLVYDRTYHVSLVTGDACLGTKIPYINTVVCDPQVDFFPSAGPFGWIKYWKLRRIYKNAARVVCVSEDLRHASARFFRIRSEQFHTCYNFVDRRRIDEIDVATERHSRRLADENLHPASKLGSPNRPMRLVAIGRLHHQKGIDVLLHALKLLKDKTACCFHATLVGDGNERVSLGGLAQSLGIADQITFTGNVDNPAPYLASADLYCLPSRGEGMPNSLIEAMLAGIPAIATDCPHGPREVTDGGKWAKLVNVDDALGLAHAIETFLADPSVARNQAVQAKQFALERFAPKAGIKALQDQLLQAYETKPPPLKN